jgi:hypothetical protein
MWLTEEDLIEALEKLDIAMSKRVLTDWREKGYLPKLTPHGRGRGQGKIYGWPDSQVISQAILVDKLIGSRLKGNAVNFVLWCCGYDGPLAIIRQVLIADMQKKESDITGDRQSGDEREDHIFDQVLKYHRAAKRHPELNLPLHDQEQMNAFLNLLTNPEYDLEGSPFDDGAYGEGEGQKSPTSPAQDPTTSTPPAGGSLLAAEILRQYFSTYQLKKALTEASDELFVKAQSDISRLRLLLAQLFQDAPEFAELHPLRFHILHWFGSVGVTLDVAFRHCGKSQEVDAFIDQYADQLTRSLREREPPA